MRCSKTRVFGRRVPNRNPQKRLRFRDLRGKTLSFTKAHCDYLLWFSGFPRGQGLHSGLLHFKTAAFCVCVVKPTEPPILPCDVASALALHRGQNPQNWEMRVSWSKNPHFPPTRKRVVRARTSPFSIWCVPCREMGIFWLKLLVGHGHFDPETL